MLTKLRFIISFASIISNVKVFPNDIFKFGGERDNAVHIVYRKIM